MLQNNPQDRNRLVIAVETYIKSSIIYNKEHKTLQQALLQAVCLIYPLEEKLWQVDFGQASLLFVRN